MEVSEKDWDGMVAEFNKIAEENRELKLKIKQYKNIIFAIESICKASR